MGQVSQVLLWFEPHRWSGVLIQSRAVLEDSPPFPEASPCSVQQGTAKMKQKSTGLGVGTQVQVLIAPDFFYSVNL